VFDRRNSRLYVLQFFFEFLRAAFSLLKSFWALIGVLAYCQTGRGSSVDRSGGGAFPLLILLFPSFLCGSFALFWLFVRIPQKVFSFLPAIHMDHEQPDKIVIVV